MVVEAKRKEIFEPFLEVMIGMLSLSGIETGYRFSKALLCIYKRLRICSFQKIQILQNSSNTNTPGKKEDELFYAQKCGNIP